MISLFGLNWFSKAIIDVFGISCFRLTWFAKTAIISWLTWFAKGTVIFVFCTGLTSVATINSTLATTKATGRFRLLASHIGHLSIKESIQLFAFINGFVQYAFFAFHIDDVFFLSFNPNQLLLLLKPLLLDPHLSFLLNLIHHPRVPYKLFRLLIFLLWQKTFVPRQLGPSTSAPGNALNSFQVTMPLEALTFVIVYVICNDLVTPSSLQGGRDLQVF